MRAARTTSNGTMGNHQGKKQTHSNGLRMLPRNYQTKPNTSGKCWSSGKSMMLQGWRQQRGRPSPAVKRAATLGLWRPAMGSPQLSAECRGRIEIDETKPNDHRRCSTFQNRNCAKHWNAKLAPIDPGGNRSSAAAFGRVASEGMGSRSQRNGETKPLRSVAMLRRDYQTKPNTSDKCWSSGKSMILHHRRRSAVGLTRSRKCEACSIVPSVGVWLRKLSCGERAQETMRGVTILNH